MKLLARIRRAWRRFCLHGQTYTRHGAVLPLHHYRGQDCD